MKIKLLKKIRSIYSIVLYRNPHPNCPEKCWGIIAVEDEGYVTDYKSMSSFHVNVEDELDIKFKEAQEYLIEHVVRIYKCYGTRRREFAEQSKTILWP